MCDASALRFSFGKGGFELALDHLEIKSGSHTAVIGPSGCGKTTLVRLLTGVLMPDAGRVSLLGRDLGELDEDARRAIRIRRVGMVFQSFALLEYLTALENILLPYRLSPHLRLDAEARIRASELAAAVGIEHTLKRRPARLSQGERQRVAICRALVTRPGLIVCDEPTGNLDPARSRATVDLIIQEAERINATVLMVTHDHGLLSAFAQTIRLGGGTDAGEAAA